MHLKRDEITIKTYRHHYFPFLGQALKWLVVSFPFFLVASFFYTVLTPLQMALTYLAVAAVFSLFIVHSAVIYFLDRLVITNSRIIHIDWKNLFSRKENEISLSDIQEISTSEKGILSSLSIFDYGSIKIETSSSGISIIFDNATDPEGIKDFIYHLDLKPIKIKPQTSSFVFYDRACDPNETEKTNSVS